MKFFDSHAHYWDSKFEDADILIPRLFAGDVSGIVNVGTSPETSRLAILQARQYEGMYTALGIHPSDCQELTGNMETHLAEIYTLLTDPASKAVALGEIGLDYYWEPVDRDKQMAYLDAQLDMSVTLDLPVVIHDREAHGDCLDAVIRHPHATGVFHSYSGSLEMAKDLIRRGWYISLSGTVSFKNALRVREVAKGLPHDRVLIETDAPYLTPHPFRGKRNDSSYLLHTASALATEWGVSVEEVASQTEENAKRVFRIK